MKPAGDAGGCGSSRGRCGPGSGIEGGEGVDIVEDARGAFDRYWLRYRVEYSSLCGGETPRPQTPARELSLMRARPRGFGNAGEDDRCTS